MSASAAALRTTPNVMSATGSLDGFSLASAISSSNAPGNDIIFATIRCSVCVCVRERERERERESSGAQELEK